MHNINRGYLLSIAPHVKTNGEDTTLGLIDSRLQLWPPGVQRIPQTLERVWWFPPPQVTNKRMNIHLEVDIWGTHPPTLDYDQHSLLTEAVLYQHVAAYHWQPNVDIIFATVKQLDLRCLAS